MAPTQHQLDNRNRVGTAIKARTDKPLRHKLHNGQGEFCFVGLCYETMREEKPDDYRWCGVSFIAMNGELDFVKAKEVADSALAQWLGLHPFDLFCRMSSINDEGVHGWAGLWEEFLDLTAKEDEYYDPDDPTDF